MSSVAVPLKQIDDPTPTPLPVEESRAHFEQALSRSLSRSLIGRWWNGIAWVIGRFTRRKEGVSFVRTVVTFNTFTLVLSFILSWGLGENILANSAELWSLIIWAGFTVLYVLVMQAPLAQTVQILSTTVAESMSSTHELANLQKLITQATRLFWHFGFSLVFAVIGGVWITYLLETSSGGRVIMGTMALYVFNYFQMGMYVYFLLVVTLVFLALSKFDFDIYANDPSNSPLIRRLYQTSNTLTLSVALLGATHYILTIVLNLDLSAPVTLVMLILVGWLLPLILFVSAHISLAAIIMRVKGKKLAQVQELIQQKEQSGNLSDKDHLENVQRLMDYYDRIKATPNSMISLSSLGNLFGSLLLPLIATILGNFTTILAFFR